jgi:hypothetical protein
VIELQLGKWKRAYIVHELNDEEESLTNPEARRFTTEIHHALVPHTPILSQLLHNPDAVSSDLVPAKRWAQTQRDIHGNAVPFCGLLTLNDQLSINNWYYKHIEDASAKMHIWWASTPIAHARTLLLASRHRQEFEHHWEPDADTIEHGSDLEQYIINQAWDKLVTFMGRTEEGHQKVPGLDIDLEALKILEHPMFSHSKDAGEAGNYQWCLDKGIHENNWNPWDSLAPENTIGYKAWEASEPRVSVAL